MAGTSIEHIDTELDLVSRPDDYDGVKRELRFKVPEFHPDKCGEYGGTVPSGCRSRSSPLAYETARRSNACQ